MARNSWTQSNFLGGEWDLSAQGALDDPDYRKALAVCQNMVPQEQGSVVLRSGTRMCGPTFYGRQGVTFSWDLVDQTIYDLELTVTGTAGQGILRVWAGDQPVLDSTSPIASLAPTNPCVMTTSTPQTGWLTGDIVRIVAQPTGTTAWAPFLNRDIKITVLTSTTFELFDMLTGASIVGPTGLTFPSSGAQVGRTAYYSLPFANLSQLLTTTPIATNFAEQPAIYLCCPGVQTYKLTMLEPPTPTSWPTFSCTAVEWCGPYLPLNDETSGTVSAASGTGITFTDTSSIASFANTDIGRYIRLFSEPPEWASGTGYTTGEAVTWNNVAYQATVNTTGKQPDQNPSDWAVEPTFFIWIDAKITAVTSASVCVVTFNTLSGDQTIPSVNGLNISEWVLGAYSLTTGVFPGCGVFHEGRLCLSGAFPGQIDMSESGLATFRPTDQFGNVNDDSAIQYTLDSTSNNTIIWMETDQSGILCGMYGEEWLVQATASNDILTPTSMQAHRQSKHGSYYHIPAHCGTALAFIHRYAGTVFEYLLDTFSQRFTGRPLNAKVKNSLGKISNVTYVETDIPIIWARNFNSQLIGCTYRRTARFANTPPEFNGWHVHNLGGLAPYLAYPSASQMPSNGGVVLNDTIAMTTCSGSDYQTPFYRQILMPPYDPTAGDDYAWCLDNAFTGAFINQQNYQPNVSVGLRATEDGTNMYFLGTWYLPSIVSVYLAGIYFGDFPNTNGVVTVPYASDPGKLGTRTYVLSQANNTGTNGTIPILNLGDVPGCLGSKYTATIKLLRGDQQAQARTENGMAVGETRRPYMASALIGVGYNNSITVGVDNQGGYPMVLREYINGPAVAENVQFSGVWQDTIDGDASYDGQITLNVTGPYPFILSNITPFSEVEER